MISTNAAFVLGLACGAGLSAAVLTIAGRPSDNVPSLPDYGAINELNQDIVNHDEWGSPIGTTSFLPVMMGLGAMCQITPTNSGVVSFKLIGVIVNYDKGDGATVRMRYGTGVAPVNGSYDTGTPTIATVSTIGNLVTLYNIKDKAKGLTLGTTYWFDAALNADYGGLARIESLKCEASED